MQSHLVRSVDVSCYLSLNDIFQAALELDYIFCNNLDCKDPSIVPHQTYPTLFENEQLCFSNIKQSFLYACSLLYPTDISKRFTKAWGYKTEGVLSAQQREKQWHTHDSADLGISGVLYLQANFNETKAGTEFLHERKMYSIKPKRLTWVLFSPKILHRPGFNFFGRKRLSIAANLYNYEV